MSFEIKEKRPWYQRKTIRGQLTFWYSIFFLLLLAILVGAIFFISEGVLHSNTQSRLKALVNENCLELEYLNQGTAFDDDEGDHFVQFRDGYLEIDDDFVAVKDGAYVALYSEDGLLYGENPILKATESLPFSDQKLMTVRYEGKTYYVFDAKVKGGNLSGLWLRGILYEHADLSILRIALWVILFVAPILTLLAILGGYYIARRLLQPIEDISRKAESIRVGDDLSKRIDGNQVSEEVQGLADNFNHMFERLHASFEAEKQFTSDAAHELRTPIAVISAECEYALDVNDPKEWKEALAVIARQNGRMADLVESLLLFARIEQSTLTIRREKIRLQELLDEILAEEERAWNDKGIFLNKTYFEDPAVEGDPALLRRLIQNLVRNAFQYTKTGGHVSISLDRQSKGVRLSISDDGIGIAKEELAKIWSRFYRGDNARTQDESTGIGLSMVEKIAKLHDIRLEVNSELGKGSEFFLFF